MAALNRVALELGAAEEVFVLLAVVHYGSTGACSHPEFAANRPPQDENEAPEAVLRIFAR
jgi:hypothetical protein